MKQQAMKYLVGQKVLIDKIFVVEKFTGSMQSLEEPRVAVITEADLTPSMGPCYTIRWIDKTLPPPKIKYWESDILGPHKSKNN